MRTVLKLTSGIGIYALCLALQKALELAFGPLSANWFFAGMVYGILLSAIFNVIDEAVR